MLCCGIAEIIITVRSVMINRVVISVVGMRMYEYEGFPDPRVAIIIMNVIIHTTSITCYGLSYHKHVRYLSL